MLKLLLCLCLVGCTINTPKEGQKIGRIVKLADEGLLYKTCEGELIRGGLMDGSGSLGSSFHFTIEDPRVRQVALMAFQDQAEVIINYRTDFITSIVRSENGEPHFVTSIHVVR